MPSNQKKPSAAERKAQSERDKALAAKKKLQQEKSGMKVTGLMSKYNQMSIGPNRKIPKNAWLESIKDPWNVVGARIPDLVTTPSVPFCCTGRQTAVANVNGDIAFVLCVGNVTNSGTQGGLFINATTSGPGTYSTWSTKPKAYNAAVVSTYQLIRPVSAGLMMRVDAAYTADQGRLFALYIPGGSVVSNTIASLAANLPDSQSVLAQPFSTEVPASTRVIEVRWVPLDVSYTTYSTSSNASANYGFIAVFGFGFTASTPVDIQWVENYEGIPAVGTVYTGTASSPGTGLMLPSARPSWASPAAMADTANKVAADPGITVRQRPADVIVGTPTVQNGAKNHGTFLDPWIDTLDKAVGVGKKVFETMAPFGMSLLPLLL